MRGLLSAAFVLVCTQVFGENGTQMDSLSPSEGTVVDVFYSKTIKGKLPMVILAHNGGAKKEDWGDFPAELASRGYIAVSIGWTGSSGHEDFIEALSVIMKKYSDKIDTTRVAAVGGCHGAVKMITMINDKKNPVSFKALVFLSVSEPYEINGTHAPILGVYSTDDHLGQYYKDFTKTYVEETITQPKKTIGFKGTPHGNELVTDTQSKAQIRKEIYDWFSVHLK